ncbi:MAG TPA: hypothetical protein DEG23_01755 [Coxiellaceae bacterium]|nr:hypothetical protein [Coxiellaceae bacterium]
MKIKFEKETWQYICLSILAFIFILLLWEKYVEYHHLKIAWSGFSPVGWIAERNFPENFQRGFPTTLVTQYEKSLPMWIYVLTESFISTTSMAKIMILLEIFLLYGLAYSFARKFSLSSNLFFKTFIIGTILAFSYSRNFDWGRWLAPSFFGQFYTIADFFRGMAFLMCLDGKYIVSSVYSALGICTHPLMAMTGIFANVSSLIPNYLTLNIKRLSVGFLVIIMITAAWYLLFFRTSNIQLKEIPAKEWFFMARLFSCHWFPDSLGILTSGFQEYVMPFLSFSILFFLLAKTMPSVQKYFYQFIFAYIGIMLLVIVGILNAHFEWSVVLTKMALQRSNEFLLLIGVPIIVALLLDQLQTVSVLSKISIVFILLSMFHQNFHWFPPTILLYLFSMYYPKLKIPLVVTLLFFLIYLVYTISGMLSLVRYTRLVILLVLMIGGVFGFLHFMKNSFVVVPMHMSKIRCYYMMVLLSAVVGIYGFLYVKENSLSGTKKALYQDFYDAQVWAKNNTSARSIFVVDPTIFYGWRDYSERSSLGNVREWLHTSFLYDSNKKFYEKGLQTFNILGIDFHDYMKPEGWTYRVQTSDLYRDVDTSFYRKNGVVKIAFFLIDQKDVFYVLLKEKTHCCPIARYENKSILIVEQKRILDLSGTKCFMN